MTLDTESLKTSGDPLADRRYGYGAMLRAAGDLAAAADLFAQTLELAPGWIAAWVALGEVRHEAGDREGAVEAWRRALALDPADPMGVELKLALAGLAPAPGAPPEGYVRALFDDYAPGFEQALLTRLGYRAPVLIRDAVAAAAPGRRFARALDIGCGTGLTGEALRPRCGWLEGLDLAPAMVEQARAKRVFDALHCADALGFLAAEERRFDLITAGDVVPYLGELGPLFAAVAQRLERGGLFVLSVETVEPGGAGWRLLPSLRYGHAPDYLAATARAAGLTLGDFQACTLRLDRGEPVAGAIAVMAAEGAGQGDTPLPITPQPRRRPRA